MSAITRAISIRQPYVELILQGKKRYEYRSQPTQIFERVYLYAALRPADDPAKWHESGKQPGELPTGKIIGTVEIVSCKRTANGYAYELRDPKPLSPALTPKNQPQPRFWRPVFGS